MSSGILYISKIAYLRIADIAYKMVISNDLDSANTLAFKNTIDEYGDKYTEVVIRNEEKDSIFCLLVYVDANNNQSFHNWLSDAVASEFFYDSFIFSLAENVFISYENVGISCEHPALFPSISYRKNKTSMMQPPLIVFHRPSCELKDFQEKVKRFFLSIQNCEQLQGEVSREEKVYRNLLDLLPHCYFISIWLSGPQRPIIVSKKLIDVQKMIMKLSSKEEIKILQVQSENELPDF